MKKIALTNNQIVLIDDEDYKLVKEYNWYASKSGKRYYARTFVKNEESPHKRKSLCLQHLIIGTAPIGKRISFKDKNSLNCQKSNLEFVSRSEAAHSYYKKVSYNRNTTEKFKGIVVQYSARIRYKNKVYNLGSFSNELDAAKAYNNKAIELYGDRASINNI